MKFRFPVCNVCELCYISSDKWIVVDLFCEEAGLSGKSAAEKLKGLSMHKFSEECIKHITEVFDKEPLSKHIGENVFLSLTYNNFVQTFRSNH